MAVMPISETTPTRPDQMEFIRKMLTNYLSILQNLREEHSLLFVMHVFFVGGAVLTLLLVLLAGVFQFF